MKLKVLCIDDSRAVHAFLKDCLKDILLEFTSAYDGEEGLSYLSSADHVFDCVFLDWEMPKKTGPEVLKEAKTLGCKIPIIMLTSKNQIQDISTMLGEGASEYIMKPFTKDIIIERLKMLLGVTK